MLLWVHYYCLLIASTYKYGCITSEKKQTPRNTRISNNTVAKGEFPELWRFNKISRMKKSRKENYLSVFDLTGIGWSQKTQPSLVG